MNTKDLQNDLSHSIKVDGYTAEQKSFLQSVIKRIGALQAQAWAASKQEYMEELLPVRARVKAIVGDEKAEEVFDAISEDLPLYEDVYEQLTDMIEPHVQRLGFNPHGVLPASVVDSMEMLLKHWLATTDQKEVAVDRDPLDLGCLAEKAKVHSDSFASPHHITFSVRGLRNLIEEIRKDTSTSPKLTDKEKNKIWEEAFTRPLTARQLYLAGMEAAEVAYGIKGSV